MKHTALPFFFFLLVVTAAITLACGSSPTPTMHTLQSVAVAPAIADAKDFPGGAVTFTATGYYTSRPSPVEPLNAAWGACYQNAPTTDISISNGVAHCTAGASGNYSVFASVATTCTVITACGGGCQVSGYAQLTCP